MAPYSSSTYYLGSIARSFRRSTNRRAQVKAFQEFCQTLAGYTKRQRRFSAVAARLNEHTPDIPALKTLVSFLLRLWLMGPTYNAGRQSIGLIAPRLGPRTTSPAITFSSWRTLPGQW